MKTNDAAKTTTASDHEILTFCELIALLQIVRVCLCCSVLFLDSYDVSVCGLVCNHCIIYLFALLCFYGCVGVRSWVVVILFSCMCAAVRLRGF